MFSLQHSSDRGLMSCFVCVRIINACVHWDEWSDFSIMKKIQTMNMMNMIFTLAHCKTTKQMKQMNGDFHLTVAFRQNNCLIMLPEITHKINNKIRLDSRIYLEK